MTTLRCLFHADDCGLTPGVTSGIVAAIRQGRLQSTSVMAGGIHAAEAMAALRELPQAFAGVHLNLLEGKACADPVLVPDLVDKAGFFRLSLSALLRGLFRGGSKAEPLKEQIFIEFCAQIDAVRQGLGQSAVRLDGHLHVHAIPSLVPVLEKIIHKYPVTYLRVPHELRYLPTLPASRWLPGVMCRELLGLWSPSLRRLANRHGIAAPDYFVGAYASGAMSIAALRRGLERTSRAAAASGMFSAEKSPLVEIMFHPGAENNGNGHAEADWYGGSHYTGAHGRPERAAELALLLSPGFVDLLRELAVTTVTANAV